MKKFVLGLSAVVLMSTVAFAVTCKRSIKVLSANEMQVDVTINKSDVSGIARLAEMVPEGTTVRYAKVENGTFDVQGNKVKVIWMQMPGKEEMQVTYVVNTSSLKAGDYDINGKFSYVENGQSKDVVITPTNFSFSGKDLIVRDAAPVGVVTASIESASVVKPAVNNKPAVVTVADNSAPVKSGKLTYGIQVLSTKDKLPADYFKNTYHLNQAVKVENTGGQYKYILGEYANIGDALSFRETLNQKGITGAFVIAWLNNDRISLDEAKKIEASR